jgi:hypothetical protein
MTETLDILRSALLDNLRNPCVAFWTAREQDAESIVLESAEGHDEKRANSAWYLKAVSSAYRIYCDSFTLMQNGSFYDAWRQLEQMEICLANLERNPIYEGADFRLDFLTDRVSAFQSLFPYKVFFSPEIIVGRKECGICGSVRSPWSNCGHEIGKVYLGQICTSIAKEIELISISIVTNPVQKYSVAFSSDGDGKQIDQYDYSLVAFVVKRIRSPFDGWSSESTFTYHPHSMFLHLSDDDLCPCKSGHAYLKCCRPRPGVIRPHMQFYFDVAPPSDLPQFELPKRQ